MTIVTPTPAAEAQHRTRCATAGCRDAGNMVAPIDGQLHHIAASRGGPGWNIQVVRVDDSPWHLAIDIRSGNMTNAAAAQVADALAELSALAEGLTSSSAQIAVGRDQTTVSTSQISDGDCTFEIDRVAEEDGSTSIAVRGFTNDALDYPLAYVYVSEKAFIAGLNRVGYSAAPLETESTACGR